MKEQQLIQWHGHSYEMTWMPLVLFLSPTDVKVKLMSHISASSLDTPIHCLQNHQRWKLESVLPCYVSVLKVCVYVWRLTAVGVLGAVRLRKDRRCWLRRENLRKDSLLREARERRELVLLKSPVSSSPLPPLSAEVDKKLSAPWRERRTFPTHPDTWDWATDSLPPRYSITTNQRGDLLCLNGARELSWDSCCCSRSSSRESLESSYAGEVAVQGWWPMYSVTHVAGSVLQQCIRWQRKWQSSAGLM